MKKLYSYRVSLQRLGEGRWSPGQMAAALGWMWNQATPKERFKAHLMGWMVKQAQEEGRGKCPTTQP
jgi:hypothetical protein